MPALAANRRKALQVQNTRIMALFEEAGFEYIRPRILQPADVFLEKSGEDIRSRTYLFTDPDGGELCLRPDLTVPTCRYHLARAANPEDEARYCYLGPAFRYHARADTLFPSEFEQAGLEWFGAADRAAADAFVLGLAMRAVREAGLAGFRIQTGDLGLIRALLESIDMPSRWRRRLLMRFWRRDAFRAALAELTGDGEGARTSLSDLVDRLADIASPSMEDAIALVEAELIERGLPLSGGREISDIAGRLLEKAADRREQPLAAADAALVEDYLAISGAAGECASRLREIASRAGGPMETAVEDFERRLAMLEDAGEMAFSAEFGRAFEYYTGFVFQIEARFGDDWLAVAGGGRYDDMLAGLGGPDVPACGLAIHTERLLTAVSGEAEGAA